MGTPSYMAPEQASGKTKEIGPLSDVYALGAILYELLTGRPPFRGATTMETLLQVMGEEPVPPSRLAKVPADLETICLKALHKKAAQRYGSAAALADDLRRYRTGEPIAARPAGWLERAAKWAKRRPALAALLGMSVAAVLILTVLGAWFTLKLDRGSRARCRGPADRSPGEADGDRREERKRSDQTSRQGEKGPGLPRQHFRSLGCQRPAGHDDGPADSG